jgi:predicted esterase
MPRTSPITSSTTSTPTVPRAVAPPKVTKPSGGTATQTGTFTRTVTTAPQPGLPSMSATYQVLVPASYVYDPKKPVPLVVSELVGLGVWDQIPETEGFILVEQDGYLGNGVYTFDYDVLILAAIMTDVATTWNVDLKRIYLTGFDMGADWTYAVGLAKANTFAALGICSGSLGPAMQQQVWILNGTVQPNVPREIFVAIRHGTQDGKVDVTEARLARDQLRGAAFPVDYLELNQGHTVTTAELQGIWDALKSQTLP